MAVNWALGLQQENAGQAFNNAFVQGQKDNEAKAAKNALSTLVQNPNDTAALGNLARLDPKTAMDFRTQQATLLKQSLGEHADNVVKGAQIFRAIKTQNPGLPDDQVWARAVPALHQAGITDAPVAYDPTYVQNALAIADALKPDTGNQVVVTPQPGAPAGIYDKSTGVYKQIFSPNDGTHQVGSPAVPQVHDQASYDAVPPGSPYMTPDGHTRVKQGGQMGAAPSGGFQ
jgi:hypothetical protein